MPPGTSSGAPSTPVPTLTPCSPGFFLTWPTDPLLGPSSLWLAVGKVCKICKFPKPLWKVKAFCFIKSDLWAPSAGPRFYILCKISNWGCKTYGFSFMHGNFLCVNFLTFMGHVLMRLWCGSRDRLWLPDRKASSKMGPPQAPEPTLKRQGQRPEAVKK